MIWCNAVKPEPGSHREVGSGSRHASGRGHAGGEAAGVTVTVRASALNKAPTGKGSSKFRGVSWHKDNMKWRATIFKGGLALLSVFTSLSGVTIVYPIQQRSSLFECCSTQQHHISASARQSSGRFILFWPFD